MLPDGKGGVIDTDELAGGLYRTNCLRAFFPHSPAGCLEMPEELCDKLPDQNHKLVKPQMVDAKPLAPHRAQEGLEVRLPNILGDLAQHFCQSLCQRHLRMQAVDVVGGGRGGGVRQWSSITACICIASPTCTGSLSECQKQ